MFSVQSGHSSRVAVVIADAKLDESKYQSKLRTLPDTPLKTEVPSDDNSFVYSEKEGTPGADAQSLYALLIREKILNFYVKKKCSHCIFCHT